MSLERKVRVGIDALLADPRLHVCDLEAGLQPDRTPQQHRQNPARSLRPPSSAACCE